MADLIGRTGNSYPSPYGEARSLNSDCWSCGVGPTLAAQTESFLAIHSAKDCISFQPNLQQYEIFVDNLLINGTWCSFFDYEDLGVSWYVDI